MTEVLSEPPFELLPNGGAESDVTPRDDVSNIVGGDGGDASSSDDRSEPDNLTTNDCEDEVGASDSVEASPSLSANEEKPKASPEAEDVEEVPRPNVQYLDESTNDIRFVDDDGWEDLLGSGRLRKRVIVEGDPKNHPARGSQVRIHFKGQLSELLRLAQSLSYLVAFFRAR